MNSPNAQNKKAHDKSPQSPAEKHSSYHTKGDLTVGGVSGHLVRLTLPMIWGIFAVISVQVVDTYFIGRLGTEKLAAITFTFPITMIITHLMFGVNIAMASVISRMIGAKDMENARRVVLHGLIMALGVAVVVSLLTYVFLNPLFGVLGADGSALNIIKEYMPLWLIGVVFLSVPSCGNSALRAAGDAKNPAIVMSLVALTNLVLDPVLIFGYFGFPALGVQGAALASMIGYIVGFIVGVYVLFKKGLVAYDGLHLDTLKDSLKRLAFIAVPAGLTNMIQPSTGAVIVAVLAPFGAEAVAAYGIASRVEAFTLITVIALATSMTPVIGQNWGAGIAERVRETINLSIKFNIIWSVFIALFLAVAGHMIASAFSDDAEVIRYTVLFFLIVPITHALGNLVFGWASAFNAMGRPQYAFALIVGKSVVMMMPAVFIGAKLGGVLGLIIAVAIVNVISGVVFHVWSEGVYKNSKS